MTKTNFEVFIENTKNMIKELVLTAAYGSELCDALMEARLAVDEASSHYQEQLVRRGSGYVPNDMRYRAVTALEELRIEYGLQYPRFYYLKGNSEEQINLILDLDCCFSRAVWEINEE